MLAARSAAETSSGTIFMELSNSPMIFVSRALLAPESISNRVITVVHKLPLASSRATRSAAGSRPARKIRSGRRYPRESSPRGADSGRLCLKTFCLLW